MKKLILVLGLAGLLFAGYLSGVKFFSNSCALGETCPYFWGYPACYFGLVMYLLITILAVLLVFNSLMARRVLMLIIIVSGLGILFAGYFTFGELPLLFSEGFSAYALGLPTCALGLIFYLAIFIIALVERSKTRVEV